MFWPSMYPSSRRPCCNAATKVAGGGPARRNPIRYTLPACCAPAASGASRIAEANSSLKTRMSPVIRTDIVVLPSSGQRSQLVKGCPLPQYTEPLMNRLFYPDNALLNGFSDSCAPGLLLRLQGTIREAEALVSAVQYRPDMFDCTVRRF